MDPDRLTEDELAERSGTSREYIRQLADLGILQADGRGTFTRQDVMRARVVTDLHAMGIETEALATALASGHLTLDISRVLAGGTLAQIARSPRWLKR